MGLTDADDLDDLDGLVRQARSVELPAGPRRRSGEDSVFASALGSVQADLEYIRQHPTDRGTEIDGGGMRRAGVDLSLEMASLLFAAGAPHPQWRWWAARAAQELVSEGEHQTAASWAAVAHDESLLGRLPPAPPPSSRPGAVVWWLVTATKQESAPPPIEPPDEPPDEVNGAWLRVARSIPAADHATTGKALLTITEFWLAEDEDWTTFHPRSYPDFELELNAAAALASRSGWKPEGWPADSREFLEAGLAGGTPA